MFHKEILTEEQAKLLPLIRKFKRNYFLVGGTAIALQIGHRRSIDFDLFTSSKVNRKSLENTIKKERFKFKTLSQTPQEWTFFIGEVKITFYQFLYDVEAKLNFENIVRIPSLLNLASMKAYTLGERAKWKDYVDLFFILKDYFSLKNVVDRANELFKEGFNERLFREQLSYFQDIDYEDEVEYLVAEPSKEEIKKYLTNIAIQ